MPTAIMPEEIIREKIQHGRILSSANTQRRLSALERKLLWMLIKLRTFIIILVSLRSLPKSIRVIRHLNKLRKETWGGNMKKIYRVDGKYYFNLYAPGWPSAAYDRMIKKEMLRFSSSENITEKLQLIFLAVTRKCPLRCEHCFEWDNLNQKETFTRTELIRIVDLYQEQGVNQIHFAGGEPMVRFRDLLEVVRHAAVKNECYIVTSGFNLTRENAWLLKEAGCRGMIVSIDHYLPDLHNAFRHHPDIFRLAVEGVQASLEAGMVTALSVCSTREFLDGNHLLPYMEFARNLGVQFVQVLEPKAVGHYEGKDVLLEEKHILLLENFFKKVNHDPAYTAYPTLMYHGYHQRRIGCYSGSRSVYIDSAGDVHACPFCHTRSYNIRSILNAEIETIPEKENLCPRYGRVV